MVMLVLAGSAQVCLRFAGHAARGVESAGRKAILISVPPAPDPLLVQQASADSAGFAVAVGDSASCLSLLFGLLAPGTRVAVIEVGRAGSTGQRALWQRSAAASGLVVQGSVHVAAGSGGWLGFLRPPSISEGEAARVMAAGERLAYQSMGLTRAPKAGPKVKERIPGYRK